LRTETRTLQNIYSEKKNLTLYFENGHSETPKYLFWEKKIWPSILGTDTGTLGHSDSQKYSEKKNWPSILRTDTQTLKNFLIKKIWPSILTTDTRTLQNIYSEKKKLTLYFENGHSDTRKYLFWEKKSDPLFWERSLGHSYTLKYLFWEKKYDPLFWKRTLGHSDAQKYSEKKKLALHFENGHSDTRTLQNIYSEKKIWPSILRTDTRTLKFFLRKKSDPLFWQGMAKDAQSTTPSQKRMSTYEGLLPPTCCFLRTLIARGNIRPKSASLEKLLAQSSSTWFFKI
jgi:hypothetical protein